MKLEEVIDFFDGQAAVYDAAYDAPGPEGYALRMRLAAVVETLGGGSGDVLDAGMGPGRLCEALVRAGWTVTGVDPSPAMVAHARRRLRGTPAELGVASITELPFPASTFDAAVATGVLEYAEDLPRAVAEISRVVRTGGALIVSVPNPAAFYQLSRRFLFYPLVRVVKRGRRSGAPPPLARRRPPAADALAAMLSRERVVIERRQHVCYQALPSPLDIVLPKLAVRTSAALERRRVGERWFSTQVLYVARKR